MAVRTLNGLAFFAGAGGLELGLHIANPNYRTVGYCEREASAAAALVARMEDEALDKAPVADDIKTFDGRPWRGLVDIISGGYPCQGESTAGKRLGNKDPRWLWPDLKRVIGEVQPKICFFENVANHLNMGFFEVATDLQAMGYCIAAGLFSAKETGASHERLRLFILAHRKEQRLEIGRDGRGNEASIAKSEYQSPGMANTKCISQCSDRGQPNAGTDGRRHAGRSGSELGNADSRNQQRNWPGQPDQGIAAAGSSGNVANPENDDGWSELQPREQAEYGWCRPTGDCEVLADTINERGQISSSGKLPAIERLSGNGYEIPLFAPGPKDFEAWKTILSIDPTLEPAICGTADGMAYRVDRLRLCGNGVSPLAAAYAYRTLGNALREYTTG